MNKNIKKAKTIASAYLEPLPVGQEWYEKRLAACVDCDYNTKNIENKTMLQKLVSTVTENTIASQGTCNLCGCPVNRKCSRKGEVCSLVSMNIEPKWSAIEVEYAKDPKITFENIKSESIIMESGENGPVLSFTSTENKHVIKLKVSRKGLLDIRTFSVACGCTVPEVTVIDGKTAILNIEVSTVNFKEVVNTRTLTAHYYTSTNKPYTFNITLKITKNQ